MSTVRRVYLVLSAKIRNLKYCMSSQALTFKSNEKSSVILNFSANSGPGPHRHFLEALPAADKAHPQTMTTLKQ